MMYKNTKKVIVQAEKLPEFNDKIIIVDNEKLPELREKIIDVMKLSAIVCSEMKPKLHENIQVDVQMVAPNQPVAVA